MGNHSIGAAFVAVATVAAERRKEGETALEILDMAADKSGVRGADAEFDDAIRPGEPMFMLILEAFGDADAVTDPDDEEQWDAFYEGPYAKFSERYELC